MSNGVDKSCFEEKKFCTLEWLASSLKILQEYGILEPSREQPVVDFKHPEALQKKLDLSLGDKPEEDEKLMQLCENVIKYSVATGHPHFHNQLYGGVDPYGLTGSIITEALNTNQYTFEVAPIFTLCEHYVIRKIINVMGYRNGDGIFAPEHEIFNKLHSMIGYNDGDGIFSPGGSLSNMYGMVLARYRLSPETKVKGLYCMNTLVGFTSEDAHYSLSKGVNWLGIGTENLVKVKADSNGRMVPQELEKMIEKTRIEGKVPFFVCATAGTTVLGAFDPLGEIADICERNNIWLHVDACWGGSLIFSRKYRKILKDLHRADSIAWNPHKMLGAPLQCSVFLTKHKSLLHQCNCASATYLFQQDKFYDVSYDTGDKSIQCGRKVDAFKLWMMWKARGDNGFGRLVDRAMACSRYFKNQISNRSGFRLVINEMDCTNVCFWYVPKRLREMTESEEWWNELAKVAPKIKEKLTYAGCLMIGYQPLNHRNLKNFFRLVNTCHPGRTFEDMDYIIERIELHGEGL